MPSKAPPARETPPTPTPLGPLGPAGGADFKALADKARHLSAGGAVTPAGKMEDFKATLRQASAIQSYLVDLAFGVPRAPNAEALAHCMGQGKLKMAMTLCHGAPEAFMLAVLTAISRQALGGEGIEDDADACDEGDSAHE